MTLERVRFCKAWSVQTLILTLTPVLPILLNQNLNALNPLHWLSLSLQHPKGIFLAKTNHHPFNLYLWPSSQLPQVRTTSHPACTPSSIDASVESECEEVDVEIVDEVVDLDCRQLPQDNDIQEVFHQIQPSTRPPGRPSARRKVSQVLSSVVDFTRSWFQWYLKDTWAEIFVNSF